jgi:allophanate hydrolase
MTATPDTPPPAPGAAAPGAAGRRAQAVVAALARAGRDEVWISRVPDDELQAAAAGVDARVAAGEPCPLAGLAFAVKDNIDVAGWPTTAGCPAFGSTPDTDAPAVRALLDAGALFVGKTNLDQFATGLVGTRSPYGAVRNAFSPAHISGGSSSGSAVAVALGLVDVALGTDTAGSGRVPAALNGIVGFKATRGVVSAAGVVPACRSFDCVTVFAPDVEQAERAVAVIGAFDPGDPGSRPAPADAPLGLPARPVVAHPSLEALDDLDPDRTALYRQALETLAAGGCRLVEIDLEPFLAAGALLYRGGFVAERHAAVGSWVDAHPDEVDPVVGSIITDAGSLTATALAADGERLAVLARRAGQALVEAGADSLVLPTAPFHPTIAEVAADPVGVNARIGRYTTFANLLDMCAVAVPAGRVGGLPFGVSLIGPAWSDRVQADLARMLEGSAPLAGERDPGAQARFPGVRLAVAGAHLSGQPLNHQLTDRGGRLVASTTTSADYRMVALATTPPKPGLVRVAPSGAGVDLPVGVSRPVGVSLPVEVWELPPAGFAAVVAGLPAPMVIGSVGLADGTHVAGFLCEPVAVEGAEDITASGGWLAYLAGRAPADSAPADAASAAGGGLAGV